MRHFPATSMPIRISEDVPATSARMITLQLKTGLLLLACAFAGGFTVTIWGVFFWLNSQPLP